MRVKKNEQFPDDLKLKDFRLNLGLNQRELAEMMSISQAQYNRLEIGKSMLNAAQILQLCDIFMCTPNDLLGIRSKYKKVMNNLDD
ncbi:hypothetical protein BK010_02385 [Tenericutes bacterium MO-XQ]|nr:hypothetical protein BK010_02385 [Tenericutes bacterium MO-XQ]